MIKLLDIEYQKKVALINKAAEESISKIRTIRSFSNEVRMISLFEEYIDQSYSFGKKNAVAIGKPTVYIVLCVGGSAYCIFHVILSITAINNFLVKKGKAQKVQVSK